MAHRCGFTLKILLGTLKAAGFESIFGMRRAAHFDLWAVASKKALSKGEQQALAARHFPAANGF